MSEINDIELSNKQMVDIQDSLLVSIIARDSIIHIQTTQVHDLHSEIDLLNITIGETEAVLTQATATINDQRTEIKKQKRLKTATGTAGILITLLLLIKIL